MSFQAMTWAVKQELPAMQKIVLLMMANRANPETGLCCPTVKTLAKECGMSIRAASNQIALLKTAGLIEIENQYRKDGGQSSNHYLLKFEKEIKFRDLPQEEIPQDNVLVSAPEIPDAEPSAPKTEPPASDAYINSNINTNKNENNIFTPRERVAEFVPPLPQDVFNYWAARCIVGMSMDDAEGFIDYWSATGWMVGNTKITDWYGKANSWVRNKKKFEINEAAKKPAKSAGKFSKGASERVDKWEIPEKWKNDESVLDANAIDSTATQVPVFTAFLGGNNA